jgi:hypothetical protein
MKSTLKTSSVYNQKISNFATTSRTAAIGESILTLSSSGSFVDDEALTFVFVFFALPIFD